MDVCSFIIGVVSILNKNIFGIIKYVMIVILSLFLFDWVPIFFKFYSNGILIGVFSYIYVVVSILLKILLFPMIYLVLKLLDNENIKYFLQKWRNERNTKLKILFFTIFCMPCAYIFFSMNILNIFSILSIDFFLSFLYIYVVIFPFLLPLLSLCLLYFVWFLVDMFKHKKCKIEQNKIENFVQLFDDDKFVGMNKMNTLFFIFISAITNNFYMLYKFFKYKTFFSKITTKKKYIFNIDVINIVLIYFLSIFSFVILYNFSDYNISLLEIYFVFIILLTSFSYFTYLFVNKSLTIIENYALEKYNIDLRYDRIYAFLFGIFYLNYAINTYKDRLTGNYNFKKILFKTKSNYIVLLLIFAFLCSFVYFNFIYVHYSSTPM